MHTIPSLIPYPSSSVLYHRSLLQVCSAKRRGGFGAASSNNGASADEAIIVQITDSCPTCQATGITVHAFTFQQLAKISFGSANVTYRMVSWVCTL